jgi:hypothetical protein
MPDRLALRLERLQDEVDQAPKVLELSIVNESLAVV